MNKYKLPKSVEINNTEYNFNSDYRDILYIFEALNDPDLLDQEKILVALDLFYTDEIKPDDIYEAIDCMFSFLTNNDNTHNANENKKPLYDWEQDFNLYVSPINKNLGYDIRGVEYLHWWTFLSAFMETGECTFNTFVGIRDKLNRGKKLDKTEERILKENREKVILKKKVDVTTQALMDEIMGKGV